MIRRLGFSLTDVTYVFDEPTGACTHIAVASAQVIREPLNRTSCRPMLRRLASTDWPL